MRDDWRIEFALQAVDDPSLFVRAPAVWADGPELTALERHVAHPDELLLRGLGLAARLVPSLGSALATATPSEQVTDAAGVLRFLREGAPILEEAGFGVLAPPWWRSARTRLSLRLKAKTRPAAGSSTTAIGLDGLCDVRWEVALGDDRLDLAELRALARLKQPLVRVRGQWVELRAGDIEAAIAAVGKKGTATQMAAGDVLRAALGLAPTSDGDGALPVTEVEADGWLGDLLAGAEDRRLQSRPTPDGFAGQLRPYQERGLGWLAFLGDLGLGACLADDMGLGKTAQLLALLVDERARSPRSTGPTLVVCPMSVVGNWQRETERFAPDLSVYVHHGPDRLDGKAFTRHAKKADLVLSTLRPRRPRPAAPRHGPVATPGPRRGAADQEQRGPHHPERAGHPGRATDRHDRHAGREPSGRAVVDHAVPQPGPAGLGEGLPRALRHPDRADRRRRGRRAAPPRSPAVRAAPAEDRPDDHRRPARQARDEGVLHPDPRAGHALPGRRRRHAGPHRRTPKGMERRGLVLATMMKLKQVCNHPAHFLGDGSALPGRSGKLTRLTEVLEEAVQEGDRALVFTQFTEMGDMLERHLRRHAGLRGALAPRRSPQEAARRDGRALPGRRRAAGVPAVAEGRAAPGST